MLLERARRRRATAPADPPDTKGLALKDAPGLRGMDHPNTFRDAFKSLGFDPDEQAALMGAHTFGKITAIGCSGQFKGIQKGPFCNKEEQLDPPIAPSQLVGNGCTPKLGKIGKCWKVGKCSKKQVRKGKCSKKGERTLNPAFFYKNKRAVRPVSDHFGGGAFWDRTPTTFDNDYFKLFHQEDFEAKNNCCGSFGYVRQYKGCMGKGAMVDRKGKKIGGPCDHSWCRKDGGHKEVMMSTKAWAEPDHQFINRASAWGPTRKLIRLPGDWALLGDNETRKAVLDFAKDQDLFFTKFKQAFGKVLDRGHSLALCSAKSPSTMAPKTMPPAAPATTPAPPPSSDPSVPEAVKVLTKKVDGLESKADAWTYYAEGCGASPYLASMKGSFDQCATYCLSLPACFGFQQNNQNCYLDDDADQKISGRVTTPTSKEVALAASWHCAIKRQA